MAKNDFQYGGWNYYTPQLARSWHDFARWLHPAMWHVPLESWQWIHLVAAPCNVTRSSGIMTLNSPGGSTLQRRRRLWDDMPWHSPKRPPYWNSTSGFDFDHITAVDMSSAPVYEIVSKSDHPQQKKMTLCGFSRWRISASLDFKGPIMGSLISPCTTFYRSSTDTIALNCLVFFRKSRFFAFWRQTDRQTNRQTNKQTVGQHWCTKPLSMSRAAA